MPLQLPCNVEPIGWQARLAEQMAEYTRRRQARRRQPQPKNQKERSMFLVKVVVHPIDTDAHPKIPAGYRWAVMLGEGSPSDLSRCANAGWCPNEAEAVAEGDQNGATATRMLQLAGVQASYGNVVELDHDPIPAGVRRLNFA